MLQFTKFLFEYLTKREIKKRASLDVRIMSFLYKHNLRLLANAGREKYNINMQWI